MAAPLVREVAAGVRWLDITISLKPAHCGDEIATPDTDQGLFSSFLDTNQGLFFQNTTQIRAYMIRKNPITSLQSSKPALRRLCLRFCELRPLADARRKSTIFLNLQMVSKEPKICYSNQSFEITRSYKLWRAGW